MLKRRHGRSAVLQRKCSWTRTWAWPRLPRSRSLRHAAHHSPLPDLTRCLSRRCRRTLGVTTAVGHVRSACSGGIRSQCCRASHCALYGKPPAFHSRLHACGMSFLRPGHHVIRTSQFSSFSWSAGQRGANGVHNPAHAELPHDAPSRACQPAGLPGRAPWMPCSYTGYCRAMMYSAAVVSYRACQPARLIGKAPWLMT